jgi:hypothetical protein
LVEKIQVVLEINWLRKTLCTHSEGFVGDVEVTLEINWFRKRGTKNKPTFILILEINSFIGCSQNPNDAKGYQKKNSY